MKCRHKQSNNEKKIKPKKIKHAENKKGNETYISKIADEVITLNDSTY